MKKNKIVISIFAAVCIIGTIVGYNQIKQHENYKYNQLAVMTQQDNGTYIKSNMSAFENDDYEFDHAVCNNGTNVTANSNGGLNLKLLGTDKCTVYLKKNNVTLANYVTNLMGTKINMTDSQETYSGEIINDYGIRYKGANPNNYVLFNNELWRIIGVFDKETTGIDFSLVKLVKSEPIGEMSWDDDSDGVVTNDWNNASLQKYLNDAYYNTLNEKSKNKIQSIYWYFGGSDTVFDSISMYKYERGILIQNPNYSLKTINELPIGLIYLSDYSFAVNECNYDIDQDEFTNCILNNWLIPDKECWTLTPDIEDNIYIYSIMPDWPHSTPEAHKILDVIPTLYLKSNIKMVSGQGTKDNPYIIE